MLSPGRGDPCTMTTYAEKLKDPRWQKKRLEVFNRDNWTCMYCDDQTKTLHVHHEKYEKGDPWDTDTKFLKSACVTCHTAISYLDKNNFWTQKYLRIHKHTMHNDKKRCFILIFAEPLVLIEILDIVDNNIMESESIFSAMFNNLYPIIDDFDKKLTELNIDYKHG